jgi:transposase
MEVPVIKWEIRVLLTHLLDRGLPKAGIARPLGVNRRTSNRWIADGELDRDVETGQVPQPVRQRKPAKLEPFKPVIHARLDLHPELTTARLLDEVKAAEYTAGMGQLRAYGAAACPKPALEPLVRFETEPGHPAHRVRACAVEDSTRGFQS